MGGPAGDPVSLAPYITYSANTPPMVDLAAGGDVTCVVRCDGLAQCFGSLADNSLGQDLTVGNIGDSPNEMQGLTPIVLSFTSGSMCGVIEALALTSRIDVPLVLGRTFYNLWVVDDSEITLQMTLAVPGVAAVLRGADADAGTAVQLHRHIVNLVTIDVKTAPTIHATYILAITRLAYASIAAMAASNCLLSSGRIVCWGVSHHTLGVETILIMIMIILDDATEKSL